MSTSKSLLLITTSYPRAVAGSEAAGSFVADLVETLARDIPVRVVAPGDAVSVEQPAPNVSVYRYAAPDGALSNLRLWHPRDALRVVAILLGGTSAAKRAVADGQVDHALALWALPSGYWARRLLRARSIRSYAVWMLGSDVWSLGRIPGVRSLLRTVMRDARDRFADGFELAEASERIAGKGVAFLPTTRRFATRGVSAPASVPPYKLLFIGRWHPNKGVDLMFDALALLDDSDWALIAEMRVYGGGPLEATVHASADALAAAGRPVTRGGYLGKAAAEEAFARCDYLILPSRIESIPVIFSDAMKSARPVVTMPVGDLPRLVGGNPPCGILAAEVTAPALASAIRTALRTSPQRFAASIATMARQFDLDRIAEQLLQQAEPT